jgi:hypothetical protein
VGRETAMEVVAEVIGVGDIGAGRAGVFEISPEEIDLGPQWMDLRWSELETLASPE